MPLSPSGYAVDTRVLEKGQCFVALKGERVDGHSFLQQAAEKQACGAVVSEGYKGDSYGLELLFVEDPLLWLQKKAKEALARSGAKVVAITGSVGKTTTKDFLATLLSKRFHVAFTPGNSNSQVGLPLALLNGDLTAEVWVLEMGLSQEGELERLLEIAPPDWSLLTRVSHAHVAFFPSLAALAKEKAKIFSHPHTQRGIGCAQALAMDGVAQEGVCEKRSFSLLDEKGGYSLTRCGEGRFLSYKGERLSPTFQSDLPGAHCDHNLLAALACSWEMGVRGEALVRGVAQIRLPEKRMEKRQIQGITFINDSYNACQESMEAALDHLPNPMEGGRKIAVLGEMRELGSFSHVCHEQVGKHALKRVEALYCLGEGTLPMVQVWKEAHRPVIQELEMEALQKKLREELREGDVVLLKGSCGMALWKVLEAFEEV